MNVLLDTHIFLWHILNDAKLPTAYRLTIQNPSNRVYLSAASVWEAVIKYQMGKLPLPAPPAIYLPLQRDAHGIAALPIDEGAMVHLANLPALHRDPFDRLLVAQALQHGLTIATVDQAVIAYPVSVLPSV
ncbi:type II toxin-antitoxin system VapC family toxin [Limnoglobus roseus]|uniref:Twitching motility protein PilT n=1 Tax=Limnoglobus roseus TaxID=2598579 RepID=A0A5C1ACL1_9BACT|nr:type II toxin-antitoxin system VapC family toxin [Limnoglobus roseus]QEL14844.1 twitching motility protein PilT [Limnoglobus roseus]